MVDPETYFIVEEHRNDGLKDGIFGWNTFMVFLCCTLEYYQLSIVAHVTTGVVALVMSRLKIRGWKCGLGYNDINAYLFCAKPLLASVHFIVVGSYF